MTTLSLLDFEAGTEGSAVTVSSPWSKTGSTTVEYRAAAAAHGAFGARFANTGTSGRYQYDYGSAQTGMLVLSAYVTPRTHASAIQYVFLATTLTSGGTNRGDVRINNTTRTVTIRNVSTAVATSTTALTVDTTYRLEWYLDHAADTQTLRIYLGDATTPVETITGAYNAADTRVLAFGPYAAATGGATDYDSVQVADDWTGPYVPPSPFPDPDPTLIGHIGDSLTAQSPGPGTTDMDARYVAAGYADADVNGISGRFVYNAGDTSGGTPAVIDAWVAADFNPYDIVIALGTNDTLSALSTNWLTGLNNLRAKIAADLPGAHQIWWVNVVAAPDNPGGMDGLIGSKSNTVADYNAFLVAELDGTTEKILDWNAYAQANLTDLSYWNTSDGIHVHMTNAGYTARNAWIAAQFMTRVTTTLSTSWALAQRATKTTSTSWVVAQRVTKTVPTDWAIRTRSATTVSTGWAVAQRVTKTTTSTWALAARVTATTPQTWDVRSRAALTSSQQWVVAGRVVKTLSTSWDTQSTEPTVRVTKTVQARWDLAQRVVSPLPTRWDVAQRVAGPTATLGWAVRARVAATTPTRWDTTARATSTTPTGWEVRSRAATVLATSWAVQQRQVVTVPTGWSVAQGEVPPWAPSPDRTSTVTAANRLSIVAATARTSVVPAAHRTSTVSRRP